MKPSNKIFFFRDRNIKGIEVCSVTQSTHIFPKHSHENFYAISLMEDGGSYWCGSQKSSSLVEPGNIAVINPGQLHSGEPAQNKQSTYKMIYIDVSHFIKNGIIPQFNNIIAKSPNLSDHFKNLYKLITSGSEQLEKEIYLTSFTELMIKNHSFPNRSSEKAGCEKEAITMAADFLSEQLERKITLDELSKLSGFSSYHFLRIFKKDMGVSPHTFRTQKRIEKTKELILRGFPLSEVALLTGFTDQSHLTNTFRNYTGATPGQFFINNK